jgi:hypothetical protein
MPQITKGLEAGSLFKFGFVGILFSMILIALIGSVGGFISQEGWNGPKGISNTEIIIENESIVDEEIDTSNGIADLFTFLTVTPFMAVMSAGMFWFMTLVGQWLYSFFKPIELVITEKGLSFFSSIKLSMIGLFFPWVFLSMFGTFAEVIKAGGVEDFKFNGEPIGVALGVTFSLIFIPIFSAMAGAVLGFMLFSGQWLFTLIRPLKLMPIPYYKNQ